MCVCVCACMFVCVCLCVWVSVCVFVCFGEGADGCLVCVRRRWGLFISVPPHAAHRAVVQSNT